MSSEVPIYDGPFHQFFARPTSPNFIVVSADGIGFHVRAQTLQAASDVFAGWLESIQRPVMHLTDRELETSEALYYFLDLLHFNQLECVPGRLVPLELDDSWMRVARLIVKYDSEVGRQKLLSNIKRQIRESTTRTLHVWCIGAILQNFDLCIEALGNRKLHVQWHSKLGTSFPSKYNELDPRIIPQTLVDVIPWKYYQALKAAWKLIKPVNRPDHLWIDLGPCFRFCFDHDYRPPRGVRINNRPRDVISMLFPRPAPPAKRAISAPVSVDNVDNASGTSADAPFLDPAAVQLWLDPSRFCSSPEEMSPRSYGASPTVDSGEASNAASDGNHALTNIDSVDRTLNSGALILSAVAPSAALIGTSGIYVGCRNQRGCRGPDCDHSNHRIIPHAASSSSEDQPSSDSSISPLVLDQPTRSLPASTPNSPASDSSESSFGHVAYMPLESSSDAEPSGDTRPRNADLDFAQQLHLALQRAVLTLPRDRVVRSASQCSSDSSSSGGHP